jgi:hypothetical protein
MKTTRRTPGVSGSGHSKHRKAVAKGWKPLCGYSLAEMISRRPRRGEVVAK